ncbi:PA14 domain-containing protein [Desulfopila sp. IMCC35008]|uniref:PA14 domain-containing protein n=1 Tax=Desulfopila sp. IMCC35008 TaxID=2653858 RepID=UPI0013D071F0|nr:PA14 domain-containing protein [Desulfopila sp. IMCC35008]
MQPRMKHTYTLLSILFALLLAGCSTQQSPKTGFSAPVEFAPVYVKELTPAPVDSSTLQPGLAATYYLDFFKRHLRHLPPESEPGKPGKPILQINHQFDKKVVFDSGYNRGVGMRLTGFIRFDATGVYEMQALSNDGVFLYIDDKLVISDPEQHADRMSNVGYVTIDQEGWYKMKLEYFQRKGTAALKLFWQTPVDGKQVPVPAKAYGHQ